MAYTFLCETCLGCFVKQRLRGGTKECKPCGNKRRVTTWKNENRERTRLLNRKSAAKPECKKRKAEYTRRYQAAHLEAGAAKTRRWRANKPERAKEVEAKYKRNNHEKLLTRYNVRRHHKKLLWANPKDVGVFYDSARRVSECLGIPHEVDHIIPLQGRKVCGLHIPENLQVLTRDANRAKGNKLRVA